MIRLALACAGGVVVTALVLWRPTPEVVSARATSPRDTPLADAVVMARLDALEQRVRALEAAPVPVAQVADASASVPAPDAPPRAPVGPSREQRRQNTFMLEAASANATQRESDWREVARQAGVAARELECRAHTCRVVFSFRDAAAAQGWVETPLGDFLNTRFKGGVAGFVGLPSLAPDEAVLYLQDPP